MSSNEDFWDRMSTLTFANEAEVETKLLAPMFAALGYDTDTQLAWHPPVTFQEGRKGRKPEADMVLYADLRRTVDASLIVVEAKAPEEDIGAGKAQGESYAANLKAPLLVLCNGREFEVWQLQPTFTSDRVFSRPVSNLRAHRGELESLLSHASVSAYARSLAHKSIRVTAGDFSAFESAERRRASASGAFFPRRLKSLTASTVSTGALLETFPSGAVVAAPSGFGKSRLADTTLISAIDERLAGRMTELPIGIFLPNAPGDTEKLRDFLAQRVSAHCPQISRTAFVDLMRDTGIVLVADGLDRVPKVDRANLDQALAMLCRDFPKTRLFVFTRPHDLPRGLTQPVIELCELSEAEQAAMVRSELSNWDAREFMASGTSMLKALWTQPLLLDLTVSHYRSHRNVPTGLEGLFIHWLNQLLPSSGRYLEDSALRDLLTQVAKATAEAPLTRVVLLDLACRNDFEDDQIEELFRCDALVGRDGEIELRHEALADYLRAADIIRQPPAELEAALKGLPMTADGNLPSLLMAMASTPQLQALVWAAIVSSDLRAATGALRYRADLTGTQPDSDGFLAEIMAGIELPLEVHMPSMARRVREHLGGPDQGGLGICGMLEEKRGELSYAFFPKAANEPAVQDRPVSEQWMMHYIRLPGMGYRLDSGRVIGMRHLRDSLVALIESGRIDGGPIWAEERSVARLMDLRGRYRALGAAAATLPAMRSALEPLADRWVGGGGLTGGHHYPIAELLTDLDLLIDRRTDVAGRLTEPPPREHELLEDPNGLAALLERHFSCFQLLLHEAISTDFSKLSSAFPHYRVMPVRFDVRVKHDTDDYGQYSPTIESLWKPVADWDRAGADVTFSDTLRDYPFDTSFDELRRSLRRLGRETVDTGFAFGRSFSLWSYLWGSSGQGDARYESAPLRLAKDTLKRSIKELFSDLPDRDHMPERGSGESSKN